MLSSGENFSVKPVTRSSYMTCMYDYKAVGHPIKDFQWEEVMQTYNDEVLSRID